MLSDFKQLTQQIFRENTISALENFLKIGASHRILNHFILTQEHAQYP